MRPNEVSAVPRVWPSSHVAPGDRSIPKPRGAMPKDDKGNLCAGRPAFKALWVETASFPRACKAEVTNPMSKRRSRYSPLLRVELGRAVVHPEAM